MLDYDLIEKNTISIEKSFNNKQVINENLCVLKNVFNDSATEKLKKYINQVSKKDWSTEQGQEKLNRRKLTFKADTALEEFHIALENITKYLQTIYPELNLKFDGMMLWQDKKGYYISSHTDNPIIAVSMQIYLYDTAPTQCGTRFYLDNQIFDVEYIHNSGYLINQTNDKLTHESMCPTPADAVRYSVYAVWIQEE